MKIFHLWVFILLLELPQAAFARCDGGLCSTCTNCSRCYHCKGGGTCSVCAGSGSTAGTGTSPLDSNSSSSSASSDFSPDFSSPPVDEKADVRQLAEDQRIIQRNRAKQIANERARNANAMRLYREEQEGLKREADRRATAKRVAAKRASLQKVASPTLAPAPTRLPPRLAGAQTIHANASQAERLNTESTSPATKSLAVIGSFLGAALLLFWARARAGR